MGHDSIFAWVVPISCKPQLKAALRLGNSLKSVKTCGKIIALTWAGIPLRALQELEHVYELVIVSRVIQENNLPVLNQDIILYISKMTAFSKLMVVVPELFFVRQCDYLVDMVENGEGLLLKNCLGDGIMGVGVCSGRVYKTFNSENHPDWKSVTVSTCQNFEETPDAENLPDILIDSLDTCTFISKQPIDKWDPRERNWVAIVGMACRFPGANSPEEYWNIFETGKNTSTVLPASRLQYCTGRIDPNARANFLQCPIDLFDADFFKMSPTEAIFTDPQARILLEVCWEAFENAAINPETLRKTAVGIFHGSWLQEYKEIMNEDSGPPASRDFLRKYLGSSFGSISAKLSYVYGFTGPNIATESGCSSAMVGVHLACQSLTRRECPLALVTGANIILQMDGHQKVLWAKDGISKTFAAGADGYGRAEGVAVLVLKRYSDALRDQNRIHGVILGSAQVQEGLTKSFGQPTVESETKVMKMALETAGVDPGQVDYLEAHATGTGVGDPIEAHAISKAYQGNRNKPLWIASGKTNVGHTESVSGLAGIIKVLLALRHETIPKHLHMTSMNPQVHFDSALGKVPLENQVWCRSDKPRLAGVSSFGITGTDVHVIIQEAPANFSTFQNSEGYEQEILGISAKSGQSLEKLLSQYKQHLTSANIFDSTYTANTGRFHGHGHRVALIIESSNIQVLQKLTTTEKIDSANLPKICFTYPGLVGSMDFSQARELYKLCLSFRHFMDNCNNIWKSKISENECLLDILNKCWSLDESKPHAWYACVLAVQYSLTKLWMLWGVNPDALMGLCMGEITTAVVAGVISLEDGYKILGTSEYFVESSKNAPADMLAMKCGLLVCQTLIHKLQNGNALPEIDIATISTPNQTVVAGTPEVLSDLKQLCDKDGIKCQKLAVEFAAHSRFVEKACNEAESKIYANIQHSVKNHIPCISSLSGTIMKDEDYNAHFWNKLFRDQVQFSQACKSAEEIGCTLYLEMGLGAALTKLTLENLKDKGKSICLSSFTNSKEIACWQGILSNLAQLYVKGFDICWESFYKNGLRRQKIDLPHYPFQRKSYWFTRRSKKIIADDSDIRNGGHPLLGVLLHKSDRKILFSSMICRQKNPWIYDHIIGDQVIFPASGYIEMITAAGQIIISNGGNMIAIQNFRVHKPLLVTESGVKLQTLVFSDMQQWTVEVYTESDSFEFRNVYASATTMLTNSFNNIESIRLHDSSLFRLDKVLKRFSDNMFNVGFRYGPSFKSICKMHRTFSKGTFLQLNVTEATDNFSIRPILFDAMIQGCIASLEKPLTKLQVPVEVWDFKVNPLAMKSILREKDKLYVISKRLDANNITTLQTFSGTILASMTNVMLAETNVEAVLKAASISNDQTQLFKDGMSSLNTYKISWNKIKLPECQLVRETTNKRNWLLFCNPLEEKSKFLKTFKEHLTSIGIVVHFLHFENILQNTGVFNKFEKVSGIIYYTGKSEDKNFKQILKPLLELSQIFIKEKLNTSYFHLITHNCWSMSFDDSKDIELNFSGLLWGFMRTFRMEQPGIISKSIDISTTLSIQSLVSNLASEIFLNDNETEVCYQEDKRLCRRLMSISNEQPTKLSIPQICENKQEYAVEFPKSKLLSDLKYVSRTVSSTLESDHVEIQVRYCSLNFKDVLSIIASDKVFEKMQMLGLDYSGVITRVGSSVNNWKVGDPVFGSNFKEKIVTSHTRIRQNLITKIPANLTFAEAAALPTVFITTYYCIVNIAKMVAGQTMLVHAASGGVGLMAVQIARKLGVHLICTAGSSRKRAHLKRLGISLVLNSRSTEFGENIKRAYPENQQPVDMVLNCLTGPGFKEASLKLVKDGGYFVEISKLDIWTEHEFKERRPMVNYQIVNAMDFTQSQYMQLMAKLVENLESSSLDPVPYSIYSAEELILAMKYLQTAQHIGKVLLEMPITGATIFSDRSTYFISGGTGAIGLQVATWMVRRGAKYLILAGRSIPNNHAKRIIDQLHNDWDCQVIFKQVDVSCKQECKRAIEEISRDKNLPPLRGVHHCAGLLSDRLIQNQNWESFDKVLKPKVDGAWNLHTVTSELSLTLEFFVMYSSMCATFGNAGQTNYTSANLFMDWLAEKRKSMGLPAMSINWGKWSEGLAENKNVPILQPFSMNYGIETLEKLMIQQKSPQGNAVVAAGLFKHEELIKVAPYYKNTLLNLLIETKINTPSRLQHVKTLVKLEKSTLDSASSPEERKLLVSKLVTRILCETLGIQENKAKQNALLQDLGMDSLMAIEFKNKLQVQFSNGRMEHVDFEENATIQDVCNLVFSIVEN